MAQASAAPQSWPTTWARSTPRWSSTPCTSPASEQDVVGVDAVGLVGRAEAAQVGGDDLVAGGDQRRDLVAPQVVGVGPAVQQHDGRALALDGHLEADALGFDAHGSLSLR